jgi:hypothetical protein
MFYNKPEFIISSFLNRVINHNILRFNLFLLKHYLPFKSHLKKAGLKQLKKRLSKRLLRLRKKSSGRLRRATKLRSLTYSYNKSNI